VCAFETIHDMCDPVSALRSMRSLRSEHGTVLLADERVADAFTVGPTTLSGYSSAGAPCIASRLP